MALAKCTASAAPRAEADNVHVVVAALEVPRQRPLGFLDAGAAADAERPAEQLAEPAVAGADAVDAEVGADARCALLLGSMHRVQLAVVGAGEGDDVGVDAVLGGVALFVPSPVKRIKGHGFPRKKER